MDKKIKTKTIKQSVTFKALPHEIYEMLMDSKLHSRFSGAKANISRKVGGKFTAYDKWIEGKNLELVKDKKIVQAWRGVDWPAKHWSTVTYKLSKLGKGTRLNFTHAGVPIDKAKDIEDGWKEHYWNKMKTYLD
jgi:activator of HSP90 ATPase